MKSTNATLTKFRSYVAWISTFCNETFDTLQARYDQLTARARRVINIATSSFLALSLFGPSFAQGIYGGRLCQAFQMVFDSEMISLIVLVAAGGAILMWMLDDGGSKVKLQLLRIGAGLGALFGIPTLLSMIAGRNMVCQFGF